MERADPRPSSGPIFILKVGLTCAGFFLSHDSFCEHYFEFCFCFFKSTKCLNILSLDFVELPTNFEENKKGTFEKPKCEENEKNKNYYSTSVIQISIILFPSRDEKHLLERCRMRFNESCQTYPKRRRLRKWERGEEKEVKFSSSTAQNFQFIHITRMALFNFILLNFFKSESICVIFHLIGVHDQSPGTLGRHTT